MKLNHLNLSVTNVRETREFLEQYFGLRSVMQEREDEGFTLMSDDNNLILTLLQAGENEDVKYPRTFHVGFIQDSEEKVNEINQQLKNAGFNVKPPRRFHGSWTFYFQAPGGFLIEVLC